MQDASSSHNVAHYEVRKSIAGQDAILELCVDTLRSLQEFDS